MKKICLILSVFFIVACHDEMENEYEAPRVFLRIEIVDLPEKKSFLLGETDAFDNMKVVEVYADGYERETADYTVQWSGDKFKVGTNTVTVTARNKSVSFDVVIEKKLVDTGLPVVYIDTEHGQGVYTKDTYVPATMTVTNRDRTVYTGSIGIRGRGNATWTYPKKPYRIRLDSKANLLGMGEERAWALMANYCDKTLMRTSIAFKLSELLDFPWTPKARFVEFVFNGEYMGNYQLTETVKQAEHRVDIPETGFIIERDNYYNQEPVWFPTPSGYGYTFKHPDLEYLSDAQFGYIKDYMNEFEAALYSDDFKDPERGYSNYIHRESFARWFLFQMALANIDTNPYIVKEDMSDHSKLSMGPVWDFEWSLGIGWYYGSRPRSPDYFVCYRDFYFYRLMQDADFAKTVQQMWTARSSRVYRDIIQHFADVKNEIMQSQELNFKRWDIMNEMVSVGGVPMGGFENEVACDLQFFINRIHWLETTINNF